MFNDEDNSKMAKHSLGTLVFLDVDDTIINCNKELNLPLLYALKAQQIFAVWLVTSYSLKWNTAANTSKNTLRLDIIRRLQRYGITSEEVIISASPYQETQAKVGDYYRNNIQAIERRCRIMYLNNQQETAIDSYVKSQDLLTKELALINERIKTEYPDIKNGKQHLIEFGLKYINPQTSVVFFDDKLEVNNMVKHLNKNNLKACNVNFKYGEEPPVKYGAALGSDKLVKHLATRPIVTAIIIHLGTYNINTINDLITEINLEKYHELKAIMILGDEALNQNKQVENFQERLKDKIQEKIRIETSWIKKSNNIEDEKLHFLESFAYLAGKLEKVFNDVNLHIHFIDNQKLYLDLIKSDYINDCSLNLSENVDKSYCYHFIRLIKYFLSDNEDLYTAFLEYEKAIKIINELRQPHWENAFKISKLLRNYLIEPGKDKLDACLDGLKEIKSSINNPEYLIRFTLSIWRKQPRPAQSIIIDAAKRFLEKFQSELDLCLIEKNNKKN